MMSNFVEEPMNVDTEAKRPGVQKPAAEVESETTPKKRSTRRSRSKSEKPKETAGGKRRSQSVSKGRLYLIYCARGNMYVGDHKHTLFNSFSGVFRPEFGILIYGPAKI